LPLVSGGQMFNRTVTMAGASNPISDA
jgi:hypothetical protein